jgi:hypothetical protein
MKRIWITSLVRDEKLVGGLMTTARRYGLDANGHFWLDDLKNMSWLGPSENILDPNTGLWVIVGSEKEMQPSSVRYGLGLLTIGLQAKRGNGFRILWVSSDGLLNADTLPTPLRGAEIVPATDASLGAKMVARANTPVHDLESDYRLDIHANPGYGIWLEVGPGIGQAWNGGLLGVDQGDIDAHGVGEAGKLPLKCVLEYPMKGLKIQLGEDEFTAWAVQNGLDEKNSYYVRVKGVPRGVLFGPLAQGEEAEVHTVRF